MGLGIQAAIVMVLHRNFSKKPLTFVGSQVVVMEIPCPEIREGSRRAVTGANPRAAVRVITNNSRTLYSGQSRIFELLHTDGQGHVAHARSYGVARRPESFGARGAHILNPRHGDIL